MEWITDPTAWAGLVTLVFIELVLGIDNLIFIAILVDKLPQRQRDFARKLGLLLALAMRIVLLMGISWLADLRAPLATVLGHSFSGRDLILLFGGLFLLWKATTEVHRRLEGRLHRGERTYKVSFWMVVTQIVVLDAVFSLDAVITAVGMVDHLMVMVIAVTIAIFMMIAVSRPLTSFVSKHPTVLILCLGFLLMVGFSLLAEAFGLDIPKGYLYAAIAFSVMIEAINQFAQARLKKRVMEEANPRQRTANAILKLLGAKPVGGVEEVQEANAVLQEAVRSGVLGATDKDLLRGVLNLSERPVHTIMTPRRDVKYVDIRAPKEAALQTVSASGVTQFIAVDGDLDNVIGILRKDDFLLAMMRGENPLTPKILHEAMFVQKRAPVMELLDIFKKYPTDMAVVIDETGEVEGVATHFDVLEAITGEFPDREGPWFTPIRENANGTFTVDGAASIYDLRNRLGIDYEPDGRFATVAGLVLHELGRVPERGDTMEWHGWMVEVKHMEGRRIDKLRLTRLPQADD